MEFCAKCGTKLKIKVAGKDDGNLTCKSCGYSEDKKKEMKAVVRDPEEHVQIHVVENVKEGKAIVEHECGRCQSNEAYIGEIPPNRFNDEQTVIVYTCVDCNKTERVQTSGGNGL
ncbi:MAG: hypothetical protein KGH65_03445 [Candidatus Micrarchaeota archaeon]|nr:hypothetical protein [Candidatus Micrarchaeota archaeon]